MAEYIDVDFLGISKIGGTYATSFYRQKCNYKQRPMMCKITGIDPKYGFKREFLQSYSQTVDKHPDLKIIKFEYKKFYGYIIGYKNFMLCHLTNEVKTEWQYFVPSLHGILTLEPEQVRSALNMPVKNRALGIWPSMKPKDEKDGEFVSDDVPF